MPYEIKNTIDASQAAYDLCKRLRKLSYNQDLWKMYENIELMIKDLGKEEVVVRQTRKDAKYQKKKQQVIDAINHLEKLMLVLAIIE